MQCKYCGKSVLGNICPECAQERYSILLNDKNCLTINALSDLWNALQFVCLVAAIIFIGMIVFGGNKELLCYIAAICSSNLIFFFGKLKGLYYSELEILVDIEMKKRH